MAWLEGNLLQMVMEHIADGTPPTVAAHRNLVAAASVCRSWLVACRATRCRRLFTPPTAERGQIFDLSDMDRVRSLTSWLAAAPAASVRTVDLSTTDMDDNGLELLAAGLEAGRTVDMRLDLSFCTAITDRGLAHIGRLSAGAALTDLNLDGVHRISNRGLAELGSRLGARARRLWLDGEGLTTEAFDMMLAEMPNLTSLSVSFCEGFTDRCLSALARGSATLATLCLRKATDLTDASLARAISKIGDGQCLTQIDLSECHQLSYATAAAIGAHCAQLQWLSVRWCWNIDDAGLSAITIGCPRLLHLGLTGLKEITGLPLRSVLDFCPALEYLDLRQCDFVDDSDLHPLASQAALALAGGQRSTALQMFNYYGDPVLAAPDGTIQQRRAHGGEINDDDSEGESSTGADESSSGHATLVW
jgi:hypothetical protein